MGSIFRSTDPTTWDDVDGIVINESAPPPNVSGIAANVALLFAACERGSSTEIHDIGSIGELYELFGKNDAYGANAALKNKAFGMLRLVRVVASDAVLATKHFQDAGGSAANRITFSAKQGKGFYGNSIKVTIAAGSTSGKKYTIQDTSAGAVLPIEIYDNLAITDITASTFAASLLITAVVDSSAAEPANCAATPLATGADGTIADTDYQSALQLAEIENAANVVFLDAYSATRNGYLKAHAALTQDKMVICAGAEADLVADAVTAVGSLRDTDGRIIYAYPWVKTSIAGSDVFQSPASWVASVISQTSPSIDPAFKDNAAFLQNITGLKKSLTRSDYIALKNAGILSFELDSDIGIKIKSGIVTQIADSSKVTILRRRMTDYLTVSIAKFLKNYQNGPNGREERDQVKASILDFVRKNEQEGILPKDSDVKTGKAKLVDTEALNTDSSIAAGFFKILYKQRIKSSMRFIVLQAEIGESVVVTDAG